MDHKRIIYAGVPSAAAPEASAVRGLPPELHCEAVSGQAAEAALAGGSCGLLICDGANGLPLLQKRALLAPEVPVVVLSGSMAPEAEAGFIKAGADACLSGGRLELLPAVMASLLEKRAARALRGRERTLEAEGRVCAVLVHDLNNSLGAIEGYATLNLRRLAEDDPLREDLGEIRKAVARVSSMTKQLLVFGRRQAVHKVAVGLPFLLSGLQERIAPLLGGAVRLETELPPGLPEIMADAGQLEQLLLCLLANARDAMPNGGVIRIRAGMVRRERQERGGVEEDFLKVSISDSGAGLPPEAADRLFEPFFSTKGKGKGSGLALAAAYGIARQHGGWIEAESPAGRGCEFSVYLPAGGCAVSL